MTISKKITNNPNIDVDIIKKFIPPMQLTAMLEMAEGEEADHFIDCFERVTAAVKSTPTDRDICECELKDIKVKLHYFFGGCDWYIGAAEKDEDYMFCFARLNGMCDCAEFGGVTLEEIFSLPLVNLDLFWNENKTMQDVYDDNQKMLSDMYA